MERVSRGSLGEVFRAVDTEGKILAVKRLRAALSFDREERDKLAREAQFLKCLDSPYFPKLLGADLLGEEPYLVMEWLEGKPLNQLFPAEQGKSFRSSFLKFAGSCLEALKIFQNLPAPNPGPPGMIHGDLNPKNLLVGRDGNVRVFDFSHAVWVQEGGTSLGGTRGYMGLEQMVQGKIDLNTDLFAMGLLWAEVLQGAPLLSGKNLFAIFLELRDMDPKEVVRQSTEDPGLQQLLTPFLISTKSQTVQERLVTASTTLRHLLKSPK